MIVTINSGFIIPKSHGIQWNSVELYEFQMEFQEIKHPWNSGIPELMNSLNSGIRRNSGK